MNIVLTPEEIRVAIKCIEYTRSLALDKVGGCGGTFASLHRMITDIALERVDRIVEKLKIAIGEA